jgi:hypothetical protein
MKHEFLHTGEKPYICSDIGHWPSEEAPASAMERPGWPGRCSASTRLVVSCGQQLLLLSHNDMMVLEEEPEPAADRQAVIKLVAAYLSQTGWRCQWSRGWCGSGPSTKDNNVVEL